MRTIKRLCNWIACMLWHDWWYSEFRRGCKTCDRGQELTLYGWQSYQPSKQDCMS